MSSEERADATPDACRTMGEVRAEIDRIDRALVRLMGERQRYIEAAARIKDRLSDVRLEWRIDDVLDKVRASAQREGLSFAIAEPVWRELMERCIAHERDEWLRRHGPEGDES